MRTRLWAALLALVVLPVLAPAQGNGQGNGPGNGRGHGFGMGMGQGKGNQAAAVPFSERFFERLADFLELSDTVKEQAKAIFDKARTDAAPLREQLATNRQQIQDLVTSATPNIQGALATLATAQADLHRQLIVIRATAMHDFLMLLTPEQREKAAKLHRLFGPRMRRGPRP